MPQKPLRILQVVDSNYPAMGGAEIQARFLARAFRARGHHVEVVAPRLKPELPDTTRIDDIEVTRIGFPKIRWIGALILCVRFGLWLWRRRSEFDAVHVHIAKNFAAVAGILRPFMPWTLTVKVSGAWEFKGGILDPMRRHNPLVRLYNWCIRRADTMQCISEQTLAILADSGYDRAKLRLIPNAVDLERFASTARLDEAWEPRFLFVGRLERVKALDVVIDAWAHSGLGRRARLTIAGKGSQREDLIARAQEAGVAGSIDFLGPSDEVPALLARATIYVQPSRMEGLSNSILEAMAAGLPIIATPISGSADVVVDGDNGLLVPVEDVGALSAALLRLADDPELARRMGLKSRQKAEARYSAKAVLNALEVAYRGEPADTPAARGMSAAS